MLFRTGGAIATLLIGLGVSGGDAFAQYYPPAQPYPPPQAYPPPQGYPPYRPLPPLADAQDDQFYDVQGRPLPPGTVVPQATDPPPPGARYGRGGSVYPEEGGTGYRALPPEVRPEIGPKKELPPQFRRTLIDYYTKEPAGTIIIDTPNAYLYLVLGNGKALRYGIGVGREGFTWSGAERISRVAEWPDWNPPEQMIERQPYLPRFMAGGEGNPLGARALYLGDTLYRIHGTNQPSTIGTFVSSGCIRLTNEDIIDLYKRVKVGTRVIVLPARPPVTAAGISEVTPSGVPSDTPRKRRKPEEVTAKLRQVDVLVSQGQTVADAIRQIGVTEGMYHRWRQESGELKSDRVKRPKASEQEAPKGLSQGEVSVGRDNTDHMKSKAETTAFEE
jgi:lipoprotein-anchoring transpeptidase ErfK/SrfK/transposase-like protein